MSTSTISTLFTRNVINVTWENDITKGTTNAFFKIGNICFAQVDIYAPSTVTADKNILKIPNDCLPPIRHSWTIGKAWSANSNAIIIVDTNGYMHFGSTAYEASARYTGTLIWAT